MYEPNNNNNNQIDGENNNTINNYNPFYGTNPYSSGSYSNIPSNYPPNITSYPKINEGQFTSIPPSPERKIKKKNNAGKIAALIAIIMAASSIGLGSGYYIRDSYISNNNNNNDNNQNNSVVTSDDNVTTSVTSTEETYTPPPTTTISPSESVAMTPTGDLSAENVYKKVSPSIVELKVYYSGGMGSSSGSATGSGIVLTSDGYIITNAHVVADNPSKVEVIVEDYENSVETHTFTAEIIGIDSGSDLAVVKINPDFTLKTATIGKSSSLVPGQTVCAIGYPMNAGKSISMGIVSGLERAVDGDSSYALPAIQTDCAINPGNSGGALVNLSGEVVGIVNQKYVYQNVVEGMGFAISMDYAKIVIDDLIQNGKVSTRPALGISTYALNEYNAATFGVSVTEGLFVASINKDAPIANSDLSIGDIIIEVNGTKTVTVEEVQAVTKNFKPGDTITLTVLRFFDSGSQEELKIDVILTTAQ